MSLMSKSLVFVLISFWLISIHCGTPNRTATSGDAIEDSIVADHGDDYVFLVIGGYRPKMHVLSKYIVSLKMGRPKKFFGDNHICGGTIISKNVVLTAAHCVVDQKKKKLSDSFAVTAGSPFLFEAIPTMRTYKIKKELVHPIFNYNNMRGDLALLYSEKNFDIDGKSIEIAELADSKPKPGMECIAFGWGGLFVDGPRPDELLYVNLTLQRRLKCAERFPMNPSVICASDNSDPERSTWKGDSGGPLMCNNKLYGVVSFGFITGGPCYFASVYEHRNWIMKNTANKLFIQFMLIPSILPFVIQTHFG